MLTWRWMLPAFRSAPQPPISLPATRHHIHYILWLSDHRIVNVGKTAKITKSNHQPNPTQPTMPTDHVPKCHICTVLDHLQRWELHHLPGQQCQCITTLCEKKFFPISSLNTIVTKESLESSLGESTNLTVGQTLGTANRFDADAVWCNAPYSSILEKIWEW